MANSNGVTIITATAEMAKQMKVFKQGETYIVQKVSSIYIDPQASSTPDSAQTTKKPKAKVVTKGVAKKADKGPTAKTGSKATASVTDAKANATETYSKKVTKRVSKKVAKKVAKVKVKATTRKSIKPEIILTFVRKNDGCNMTAIEAATKLPQATIRRMLNSARDSGNIRTEGQRRGLRYFANAETVGAANAESDQNQSW